MTFSPESLREAAEKVEKEYPLLAAPEESEPQVTLPSALARLLAELWDAASEVPFTFDCGVEHCNLPTCLAARRFKSVLARLSEEQQA